MSQSREPHEPFVRHGDQLEQFLQNFWQRQVDAAESEPPPYGRHPPLPLARIKKVMKSDPDVRMIASDAPVLFCKACEIFIQEITCRAFLVADAHKRRTISKADIAKALAKSDHFDFLIDVVPRDEAERAKTQKLINSGLEAEAAAEQAAASASQSSNAGHHSQQPNLSPTSHHGQGQQQPQLSHPQQPGYQQQQPHMGMSHHQMHGHQVHPHQQQQQHQHQPRPHSAMMQQHERSNSAQGGGGTVHGIPPPPLNLTMAPGGGAGRGPGRPHSHSGSQSQPPPLIPNANLRSPTTGNHPQSFGHGHQQMHGAQGQAQHQHQQQQQQQQNGGNRRASVSSRMSLSPTIPLSTSRMEPPDLAGR